LELSSSLGRLHHGRGRWERETAAAETTAADIAGSPAAIEVADAVCFKCVLMRLWVSEDDDDDDDMAADIV
jgi:hypothetical protein